MKLHAFKQYIVALLLLGFCGPGWAVVFYPIPSITLPVGSTVGADDGSELFSLSDSLLNFEILDRSEGLPFQFEFGYYFGSDAADNGVVDTFYPIFLKTDPVSLPLAFDQKTLDIGSTDAIGFYLQFDEIDQPGTVPSIPATTLFSQAALNTPPPGQTEIDWVGAYPVLTGPSPVTTDFYLLSFFYPVPPILGDGSVIPINITVSGPAPIPPNPVPVPGAIFLWLTGLAGVALFRRRLAAGNPVTVTAAR